MTSGAPRTGERFAPRQRVGCERLVFGSAAALGATGARPTGRRGQPRGRGTLTLAPREVPDVPRFELAPDWVCEILSPSTQRIDRVLKLPIYGERGVQHIWLIDPVAEVLGVYERRDDAWTLLATHGGDEVVRVEPFPEAELPLPLLWGR